VAGGRIVGEKFLWELLGDELGGGISCTHSGVRGTLQMIRRDEMLRCVPLAVQSKES